MSKVFISHATPDQDVVEREIIGPLHDHGTQTWYSKEDIQTADEWEKKIRHGLESCDWFLVAMSPRSLVSRWVAAEVHWAMDHRPGRVVPVLLDDCNRRDFHLMIPMLQYVDFRPSARGPAARQKLLAVWPPNAPPPSNPFVWRGGITDPAAFFDREREQDTLRDYLRNGQNCQVVGPRRIGKTSLLRQIARQAPNWVLNAVAAYVDLQDPRCRTLAGWLHYTGRRFGWPTPATNLEEFAERVEEMAAQGRRPMLCLDEFEELKQRPTEFTRDFFLTLRSCGQGLLCLVTASRSPLSDLTDPKDDVVSPFYNIFARIPLGPFFEEAAKDFVTISRPGVSPFSAQQRTRILAFARQHPLALQIACFRMLEAKENGEAAEVAVQRAEDDVKVLLPSW